MKYYFLFWLMILPFFSYGIGNNKYIELIQRALDKQSSLCLGETQWPVSIHLGESTWINAKMEALVDAGLVKSNIKYNRKEWSLTRFGLREFKKNNDLCYGSIRVKNIEKIVNNGNGNESVIFHYYIENLPLWAKDKSIRVAYTDLDNLVMGIDSARYQADFLTKTSGSMRIIGEPYQLDLLY